MEKQILASGNPELIHLWSNMQTSNHFQWMSTKDSLVTMPYHDAVDAYERFKAVIERLHHLAECVHAA